MNYEDDLEPFGLNPHRYLAHHLERYLVTYRLPREVSTKAFELLRYLQQHGGKKK